MKFTKYFMPFAALALLASCSNDNQDAPASKPQPLDSEAYLAVSIAMPSNAAGRAESLGNGTAEEYAVFDGTIYIFSKTGSSEDEYTYVTKGTIDPMAWSQANPDGSMVTTSSKLAVATISASDAQNLDLVNGNYAALVILNKNKLGEPSTTFGAWKETTYEESATNNIKGDATNGFTMTNAPQYAQLTGDAGPIVHTLVDLDKGKISTVANANLEPAAEVYVQRIAAKIELKTVTGKSFKAFNVEIPSGSTQTTPDQVVFSHWGLTYYNTNTFPVQRIEPYSGTWLLDGGTQVGRFISSNVDFKRVYWGVDPNYSSTDSYQTYPLTKGDATVDLYDQSTEEELAHIDYCLENTMEYDQMEKAKTTAVILKGVYNLGGKAANLSFVATKTWRSTLPNGLSWKDETTGQSQVNLTSLFNEEASVVLAAFGLQQDLKVDFYAKGVVYYAAQIRHFDNTETPRPQPMESLSSYSYQHRGRYGVLRNNWYEVNIEKINGLGEPTIPTPDPGDPDDPTDDLYMTVTINILSWAKRSNNYEL